MRVVFFGTPDFAVATLHAICHSEHEIVGVVTAQDKPAGRGLKIQGSEVKQYAVDHGIPILQPVKLKDADFIKMLIQWNADIFVVVAFRFLPYEVYSIPPRGTFNVHASLLPQYRGAAPIHWAIMNGETRTGITTFFLTNEIDSGDIILQKEIDILPTETTGEVYTRLKYLGAEAALTTLSLIAQNGCKPMSQNQMEAKKIKSAPKIHPKDTLINWNSTAKDIFNKIRGLAPHPGALTFFTNENKKKFSVKIFKAAIIYEKNKEKAGKIITDDKTFFNITTKDFQISVHNLQIEGKKRLDIIPFLQGNKISNYIIIA